MTGKVKISKVPGMMRIEVSNDDIGYCYLNIQMSIDDFKSLLENKEIDASVFGEWIKEPCDVSQE